MRGLFSSDRRGVGGCLGVSAALLVLTVGCAGTSGLAAAGGGGSSDSADSTVAPAFSASVPPVSAPSSAPASGSPSTSLAPPVATRTTQAVATKTHAYTPPAAPAPVTQAPQPAPTTHQAQSCYPLTNSGKCYTPGEYCRDDDHGVSGVDADGDAIKCEDDNGWRWERV